METLEVVLIVIAVVFVVVAILYVEHGKIADLRGDGKLVFQFDANDLYFGIYEAGDEHGFYIRLFENPTRYVTRERLKRIVNGTTNIRGMDVHLSSAGLVVNNKTYPLYPEEQDKLRNFINEL